MWHRGVFIQNNSQSLSCTDTARIFDWPRPPHISCLIYRLGRQTRQRLSVNTRISFFHSAVLFFLQIFFCQLCINLKHEHLRKKINSWVSDRRTGTVRLPRPVHSSWPEQCRNTKSRRRLGFIITAGDMRPHRSQFTVLLKAKPNISGPPRVPGMSFL